jgi:hypothetical protein
MSILLVAQYSKNKSEIFSELLIAMQQRHPAAKINAVFAPRVTVKVGRKRIYENNKIVKSEEPNLRNIPFDDFYSLLAACLFEDSLLVSTDRFGDFFPHNLKGGSLKNYSLIMSSAQAMLEDAKVIDKLR